MAYRGPRYSCKNFDEAISQIEAARDINGTLRDDNETLTSELDDAKKEIDRLERSVSDLTDEIERLRRVVLAFESEAA